MYKQIFYALKGKSSKINGDCWRNIYNSMIQIKACGKGPYFKVKVREAKKSEKSPYWGWKDFKRKAYSMIYPDKRLVEMCSPDGFKHRIKLGEGKLVNLVIEKIGEVKED